MQALFKPLLTSHLLMSISQSDSYGQDQIHCMGKQTPLLHEKAEKNVWPFVISHTESRLFCSCMCTCGLEQALARVQIVNIFASEGHMVSAVAPLLCPYREQPWMIHKPMGVAVYNVIYKKQVAGWIWHMGRTSRTPSFECHLSHNTCLVNVCRTNETIQAFGQILLPPQLSWYHLGVLHYNLTLTTWL